MKQSLLSNNAVEVIETMRSNYGAVKADLCDAFADAVFNAVSGNRRKGSWRILTALQEYAHLIDCLTLSDTELGDNDDN